MGSMETEVSVTEIRGMIREMNLRIVRAGEDYYVQRRRLFGWRTVCFYHIGKTSHLASGFVKADEPYTHLNHTIPLLSKETTNPTVNITERLAFWSDRPPRIREEQICKVVDVGAALSEMERYRINNPVMDQ